MSERSLKLVARITGGSTPSPRASNWEGDTPFVTPPDLNGLDGAEITATARTVTASALSETRMVPRGVLVSCRAPIGHIGTARRSVTFNQGCKSIEPEVDDLKFLAYVLVARRSEMQALGRGTTFLEISGQQLGDLKVPWPPLPTQRRIADYLDRETAQIDAMTGALDGLVARLEERRSAVITRAVWPNGPTCDTVPLRALTGRDGILTDGDWVESKDQDPHGCIRLLQLADIGEGKFRDKSDRWINPDTFTKLGCTKLEHGDILIARIPDPIARATIFPKNITYDCVTVVDVCILRTSATANSRYAMWAINSPTFRADALLDLKGSTRQRISKSNLGRLQIPLPPLDEQRRIADHLDAETAKIDAMIAKAGELRALLDERRSALITATVTGQHPVPEEP